MGCIGVFAWIYSALFGLASAILLLAGSSWFTGAATVGWILLFVAAVLFVIGLLFIAVELERNPYP